MQDLMISPQQDQLIDTGYLGTTLPRAPEPSRPDNARPPVATPQTAWYPPPARRKVGIFVLLGVLVTALVTTTVLWITAQSELSSVNAAAAVVAASQAEVPEMLAIASEYFPNATGDSGSAHVVLFGSQLINLDTSLSPMLQKLGFSSAVIARMESTRALDGTQTAQGKNCNVSWTYHPDHGLDLTFESQ